MVQVINYFPSYSFKYSMDASEENSRLGRLLNHAETNAERNCRVKVKAIQNVPHLCIFSIRLVVEDQECI